MAQQISGDPRARYIFSEGEDLWTDSHNRNWTETVEQGNRIQEVLLGDATEATLSTYTADALVDRVGSLETTQEDVLLEQGSQDTRISAKPDTSLVETWLEALAVGTVAGGNTDTILLETVTQSALIAGDRLFIVDAGTETISERVVTADVAEDVTSIPVDSGDAAVEGATVILHPGDARVDPTIDLSDITDSLWGPGRTAEDVEGDHETRLRSVEERVQNVNQQIRAVGSLSSQMRNEVQEFQSDVVGTVTELQTTAEGAALQASTFTPGDKPVLKLTQNYEEQNASEIAVEWTANAPRTGFEAGDILVLQGRNSEAIILTIAATDIAEGTATIPLDQSYTIDADVGAEVFLAVTSVASKIEARTNGNVVVEGKAARSARWDGELEAVDIDGETFHRVKRYSDPDQADNARGSVGWVLTSAGEFVATNAFLRGSIALRRATLEGGMLVDEDAYIRTVSGNWSITDNGFNVAPSEAAYADIDQALTFADNKHGTVGMIAGRARGKFRGLELSATAGEPASEGAENEVLLRLRSENDIILEANDFVRVESELGRVDVNTALFHWKFPTSEDFGTNERRDPIFDTPEAFVDWAREHRQDAIGTNLSQDQAASKLKGYMFVDAADYSIKFFHPSMLTNDVTASSDIDATTDFSVAYQTRTSRSFSQEVEVQSGRVINYKWEFGDGNQVEGPRRRTARHTYAEAGSYTVTLTATIEAEDGSTSTTQTKSEVVEIKPEKQPPSDPEPDDVTHGNGGRFGGGGMFHHTDILNRDEIRIL